MPFHEKQKENGLPPRKVTFDSPRTRVAWELGLAIDQLLKELPPESEGAPTEAITFDAKHEEKGRYAIILSGGVLGTGKTGVFLVPHRSLQILNKLGIPYQPAPAK